MRPAVLSLWLLAASTAGCPGDPGTGDADADAAPGDVSVDAAEDAADASMPITGAGGTVDLLHFSVFGDVRPPQMDDTTAYPRAVFTSVIDGLASLSPQFGIATGDYMYASPTRPSVATEQIDMFLAAEQHYGGHVFHALGNHECSGGTLSNCMAGDETPNVTAFRTRLIGDQPALYYDWTVHTSLGDAHFIATAPNGWSSSQGAWLTRVLAQPAQYTFVIAHEPPTSPGIPPASDTIEQAVAARAGGVTLRFYGHTHTYRRLFPNGVITGNAGAPLDGSASAYGFVMVDQRADGNIVVTQYEIGRPPMAVASFVVHADGTNAP